LIYFLLSNACLLWLKISQSELGPLWNLPPWSLPVVFGVTPSFFELLSETDLLYSCFRLFCISTDLEVFIECVEKGNTTVDQPLNLLEWGLITHLYTTGPDILVITLIQCVETAILQCLGVFGLDRSFRLIPTTLTGLVGLVHFVCRNTSPSYPYLVSLAKWPELFSMSVIVIVGMVYGLSYFATHGRLRQRPATPFRACFNLLSEPYAFVVFKLGGMCLDGATSAPFRYEEEPFILAPSSSLFKSTPRSILSSASSGYQTRYQEQPPRPMESLWSTRFFPLFHFHMIYQHFMARTFWRMMTRFLIFLSRSSPRLADRLRGWFHIPSPVISTARNVPEHSAQSLAIWSDGDDDQSYVPSEILSDDDHGDMDDMEDTEDEVVESEDGDLGETPDASADELYEEIFHLRQDQETYIALAPNPEASPRAYLTPCSPGDASEIKAYPLNGMGAAVRHPVTRSISKSTDATGLLLSSRSNEEEGLDDVEDRLHLAQSFQTCVVCQCNSRTIVLRPCNCLVVCDECREELASRRYKTCPTCRRNVTSYSKVYQP
jgi:hypothetical protein